MIEIKEIFAVSTPPREVYEVLSDPQAVVECVQGATLGETHEDGGIDGSLTVKFSAMRIVFKGRFFLDLEPQAMKGTLRATGRDGQGGTKFNAVAEFEVAPSDGGAASEVTAVGTVELSGKMAAMISGAANAVVRRMTAEFVEALARRCASSSAHLAPATAETPGLRGSSGSAPHPAALLLHGFGGSPNTLRGWGEALATAGLAVDIPRLPGHGTTWKDLNRTTFDDWNRAADCALSSLLQEHPEVYVMGISLGALLALRLAEERPGDIAGLVMVNPLLSELVGTPRWLGFVSALRRSVPLRASSDIKMPGQVESGYDRIALKAAASLKAGGLGVAKDLGKVRKRILLVTSADDHVVHRADAERLVSLLPNSSIRHVSYTNSYHLIPLDYDAPALFAESVGFVRAGGPPATLVLPAGDLATGAS